MLEYTGTEQRTLPYSSMAKLCWLTISSSGASTGGVISQHSATFIIAGLSAASGVRASCRCCMKVLASPAPSHTGPLASAALKSMSMGRVENSPLRALDGPARTEQEMAICPAVAWGAHFCRGPRMALLGSALGRGG